MGSECKSLARSRQTYVCGVRFISDNKGRRKLKGTLTYLKKNHFLLFLERQIQSFLHRCNSKNLLGEVVVGHPHTQCGGCIDGDRER